MAFLDGCRSRLGLHSAATDHLSSPKHRDAADLCTRARFWGIGEELLNFEFSDDQPACAISRGSERAATACTQRILESEESYDAELEERGDRPHRTSGWVGEGRDGAERSAVKILAQPRVSRRPA